MSDKTKLREAFLLDTVTLPEQKVLRIGTEMYQYLKTLLRNGN